MAIAELRVAGYRSIRNLRVPLSPLNLITGPNGCGKSNLYRAVWLLHAAAAGTFAQTLAEEGGMPSLLWAGPRRREAVRLTLGARFDDGVDYELSCGLPEPNDLPTATFRFDPMLKEETIRHGRSALVERGKSGVALRDADGNRVSLPMSLTRTESVLTQIVDPRRFPHLGMVRETLLRWRFYHAFRTDPESPLRQPRIGVFTPRLAHDGRDLAAALATILEIGDAEALHAAVDAAFDGARVEVVADDEARFRVRLRQPGLLRPLEASELSDGTLRFLCLLAALLSPRMPPLLSLNEPETSLHADVLPALASLIVRASQHAQLWVVTHSEILARTVGRLSGVEPFALRRENGETVLGE